MQKQFMSEWIASNIKLIVMTLISFRWYIQLKNVAEMGTSVMSFLCLISNDVYPDSKWNVSSILASKNQIEDRCDIELQKDDAWHRHKKVLTKLLINKC